MTISRLEPQKLRHKTRFRCRQKKINLCSLTALFLYSRSLRRTQGYGTELKVKLSGIRRFYFPPFYFFFVVICHLTLLFFFCVFFFWTINGCTKTLVFYLQKFETSFLFASAENAFGFVWFVLWVCIYFMLY